MDKQIVVPPYNKHCSTIFKMGKQDHITYNAMAVKQKNKALSEGSLAQDSLPLTLLI